MAAPPPAKVCGSLYSAPCGSDRIASHRTRIPSLKPKPWRPLHSVPLRLSSGMDTTSTVLSWSVLFMAHHQDVRRRVRAEIAEKLGADRQPSYSDRTRMRYTEAVVNEALRFGANSPMALPHRATRAIRVRDWLLPRDTLVMSNLYAAHRQPDLCPTRSTSTRRRTSCGGTRPAASSSTSTPSTSSRSRRASVSASARCSRARSSSSSSRASCSATASSRTRTRRTRCPPRTSSCSTVLLIYSSTFV